MPKFVKAWGVNTHGQLGLGHKDNVSSPTKIEHTFGIEDLNNETNSVTSSIWAWVSNKVLEKSIKGRVGISRRISSEILCDVSDEEDPE